MEQIKRCCIFVPSFFQTDFFSHPLARKYKMIASQGEKNFRWLLFRRQSNIGVREVVRDDCGWISMSSNMENGIVFFHLLPRQPECTAHRNSSKLAKCVVKCKISDIVRQARWCINILALVWHLGSFSRDWSTLETVFIHQKVNRNRILTFSQYKDYLNKWWLQQIFDEV